MQALQAQLEAATAAAREEARSSTARRLDLDVASDNPSQHTQQQMQQTMAGAEYPDERRAYADAFAAMEAERQRHLLARSDVGRRLRAAAPRSAYGQL